jgi:hypothetical protein
MEKDKLDLVGAILLGSLFILLAYASWLSYKSIDWDVLKRLESQTLVLPTQIPPSPQIASPSAIASP